MTLDAVVSDDGTLIAKAPKSLHGKHIKITIVEKTPKKPSQWENISAVLEKSETLDIPRRTIDDILQDIHSFRESE